ncbi:hypothetical protein M9Y10_037077 [Tritrichomonas musculus]|uniref:Uncharacterized protein n=1 Tax=Tritrichomonas musculus TaxID=1915356 RepID=A0ABR2GUJ8_9EUKA
MPYSTTHLGKSARACFQPGNTIIDEMGIPFNYWLKDNISSYLWDTKHCTYSDSSKLTSNPCTIEFEYASSSTSMDVMMAGRSSSTRSFQHDTFEICFNIPSNQLNQIRIAMGWWYNGNGCTNYTCPPIRYLFKRNT